VFLALGPAERRRAAPITEDAMSLKDVLVHVDTDPTCASRVDIAARLAAWHDAHLTGLHVMASPPIPGYIALELPREVHEFREQQLLQVADQARQLFDTAVRAVRVPRAEWRAEEGDILGIARLHGRYFDLVVVGQGIDVDDPTGALAVLPEELALSTGRPVLVVPRYGTFAALGDHVLVGWNASREAARAVNDALPLLRRAQKVTVLSIDPGDHPDQRIPGADITLHLARHGVNATAAQTRAADIAVGDVLLSYVADIGADLIVCGAYGHSRLREVVLGGATRHLLQHMTVPVLMSQ
jgi:nucleotide-binding universal stress UspA family protein